MGKLKEAINYSLQIQIKHFWMDSFKLKSFKVLGNIMSKHFTAIVLKRVPERVSNSVRKYAS